MTTREQTQPRVLRLGTRASLLAVAQSRLVADALTAAHPDLQVELVQLGSRGDTDQDTPLHQVADAQFFSDELDTALVAGEVDFCVHSWKDIDGERPSECVRAAVPARALPHDVILFRADVMDTVRNGTALRIGTCSERRHINTADFLEWALPACGARPEFEFVSLRGPVDERVARIGSDAAEPLDGVVLALAGLARLWQDPAGNAAIRPHLENARWMVLPLSQAPAAAAQGALAVETRADNRRCRELLRAIHDPVSEQLVTAEQALLANYGAAFGATAVSHPEHGYVLQLRGRDAAGDVVRFTGTGSCAPERPASVRRWSGNIWKQGTRKQLIEGAAERACQDAEAVFVAHADALTTATASDEPRYWTSGPESWARLAARGIWVEGCADNLGFNATLTLLQIPVLQLPPLYRWTALTHRDAVSSWSDSGVGTTVATYAIDIELDEQLARQELADCTHFYWASARQYTALQAWLPANAHHSCGGGKTLQGLRAAGLTHLQPFVSRREWRQWAA